MDARDPDMKIAHALVAKLTAVRGDEEKEREALQEAVDACVRVASADPEREGLPVEQLMLPEYFCEDTYDEETHLSVIETAAALDEDDEFRWREWLADMCGY